jgi:hypothetical protein
MNKYRNTENGSLLQSSHKTLSREFVAIAEMGISVFGAGAAMKRQSVANFWGLTHAKMQRDN